MKIIKLTAAAAAMAFIAAGIFTGCIKYETPEEHLAAQQQEREEQKPDESEQTRETAEGQLQGLHHVEIDVKDYGTISVELDADTAPITVTNFINLAQSGFYDGLTFHRIMDGFMIQGGDPEGTGMGGSDQTITGEFANNGIPNDISHVRGVISMARNGYDMNSASSQFFIVQTDSTFLDGDYAGFGHVTDGMDIVDSICADTVNTDNNGGVAPGDQPVITEVRVID